MTSNVVQEYEDLRQQVLGHKKKLIHLRSHLPRMAQSHAYLVDTALRSLDKLLVGAQTYVGAELERELSSKEKNH